MNKPDNDLTKIPFQNSKESNIIIPQYPINSQNQIDSNSLNQLLSVIYDDEFVIMINDLSHTIKVFNKLMIQFINQSKSIIVKNFSIFENSNADSEQEKEKEIKNLPGLFSNIESGYKNFFSSAKIIFKKMKKYRNERLENINKLPLGEKNLKFCFINVNKTNNLNQANLNENVDNNIKTENNINDNKLTERNIYNPSPIPNRKFMDYSKNEENAELKKKLFTLEKKIENMGSNKNNIITNNINNINNFHLKDDKKNDIELIRENNNIIKAIKILINILEYENSPDFSYSKNTFDNMEEIAEHKNEIKQQKNELINIIKKYLSSVENNKIFENIEIHNFNNDINLIKKIDELKKINEKLDSKVKDVSLENEEHIEEIKKLGIENIKMKEDFQNQEQTYLNQIIEIKE